MTTHTGPAQPQDGPPFRLRSVAVSAYGPTVLEAMGSVGAARRAPSTLGGTHRIGIFLGPLLAAPIIASYGVRSAFLFSAAMSLLAFALVLRVPDLCWRPGGCGAGSVPWTGGAGQMRGCPRE
ncbi:hypothetical protein [Nostocoides australiense]